jgi:MFS family permease
MEGLKVAYRTPKVMALLLVMLVVGIFGWSYVILLPSLARETLNTDATGYGWMMSATGLGSVIGALWIASTKDMGSGRFMVGVSVGIFAVAALALSFSTSLPIVLLLLLPCGFGLTAFFSGTNTLIQSSVSDSVRGRVMGIYTLAFGTLMPLGALYAGSLAEWTSTPLAIRIGASICLVTAIVTFVKKPPVSDRAGR